MSGGGSGKVQETSAQKALAQHAKLVMDDYTTRWLPVQQNLATQIEDMGKSGSWQRTEAAGKASTDTAIQFAGAQGALQKSLSNSGAAPGSGRADLATVGLGDNAAKSSGLGQMISGQQIDDAYTKGLGALTQIGQGDAATVSSSMENQAASSGLQAQADAKASLEDAMGIGGALGTAAGLAGQQYAKPGGHDSSGYPNIPGIGPGPIG